MSIEDSRKNVKIIIEELIWKNLHHKLHKNILDVIVSKLTLSFVICFERFTSTININGNDAYVEDRQNLLKVLSYQSFSR